MYTAEQGLNSWFNINYLGTTANSKSSWLLECLGNLSRLLSLYHCWFWHELIYQLEGSLNIFTFIKAMYDCISQFCWKSYSLRSKVFHLILYNINFSIRSPSNILDKRWFIFHQMIALQKLWKVIFISPKKLFSF